MERGRVRVAPSEIVLPGGLEPLTLILSALAKGRGETNGMGLTTGEHYRSLHIALKSY